MSPAVYDQTTVHISAGSAGLKVVGSIIRFLGFMTLYVESTDETNGNAAEKTAGKGQECYRNQKQDPCSE